MSNKPIPAELEFRRKMQLQRNKSALRPLKATPEAQSIIRPVVSDTRPGWCSRQEVCWDAGVPMRKDETYSLTP